MTDQEKRHLVQGMHKNASIYVGVFATLHKQYGYFKDQHIILNENHTQYSKSIELFLRRHAKLLLCEIETAANLTGANISHMSLHEMKRKVSAVLNDFHRTTPDFDRDIINAAKKFSRFARSIINHIAKYTRQAHKNRKNNNKKNMKKPQLKKRKNSNSKINTNNTIESRTVMPKIKLNRRRKPRVSTTLPPLIVENTLPINATTNADETMPTTLRPNHIRHKKHRPISKRTTQSF